MTKGPSASLPTILLVEDDEELANEIKAELEGDGFLVRRASIADAAHATEKSDAAMLILDRILDGVDSLHTLEIMRRQGAKIPVLIISASSSVDDIAEGLRAGADDYLAKPFYMAELVARVEAMLRRLGDISTTRLIVGDLEIDLLEQTAFRGSAKLNLLPREFKLLEYFARRPGQLVTRAMLLKDVWHYEFEVETNVVDTHISNLRRKIDDHGLPSRIANVRGLGYMLRAHAA
ncbi:response regulator transcription factor [Bradyrhizobium sp.]|uniref:response regulator transcription factor n=1 Tax=Bradyrhizobium sp. TaxID=376 RepID=UPI002629A86A|nr:response regulator transcription factor [Bradyrhizobium sp.]